MDVLRWWAPVLAVAALLTVNLVRPPGGPADLAVRAVSMLLLVLLVLVSGHATVISSGFNFRTRDTVRIALYLLGADHQRTLAFVSLLIHDGRSVVEVARQAGHAPTMTLSTYAHVFDEFTPACPVAGLRATRHRPGSSQPVA